jgi:hypothetical protein
MMAMLKITTFVVTRGMSQPSTSLLTPISKKKLSSAKILTTTSMTCSFNRTRHYGRFLTRLSTLEMATRSSRQITTGSYSLLAFARIGFFHNGLIWEATTKFRIRNDRNHNMTPLMFPHSGFGPNSYAMIVRPPTFPTYLHLRGFNVQQHSMLQPKWKMGSLLGLFS